MLDFVITKDIPIPTRNRFKGKKKYPFDNMNVGECAIFRVESLSETQLVRSALSTFAKQTSKKFTTRTKDDNLYVWRVE